MLEVIDHSPKDVLFKVEYFDYFKDHLVCLMLSQLHYWYTPDSKGNSKLRVHRNGKWWLAKTHVEWYKELRLSRSQVNRCLKVLEDAGVIEVITMGFNGRPTTHIMAIGVNGNYPLKGNQLLIDHLPNAHTCALHCTSSNNALHVGEQSNTESTAKSTTETLAIAKAQPTDTSLNKDTDMKGPSTANQALAHMKQLQAKQSGVVVPDKVTSKTLQDVWKRSCTIFVAAFTAKQRGQFTHILKRIPQEPVHTLNYVLENWVEFTKYVEVNAAAKNTPLTPNVDFVLKYCSEAYNYYLSSKPVQLIAKPKQVKEVKKVVVEENPDDAPATLEQLLAME